ncbi:T9SS type A sorting domain-containing protein [bacterium]|nr:T9SS type A sorting domain-containing protein [bacterium]
MKKRTPWKIFLLTGLFCSAINAQEIPRTAYVLQGWGANSLSKINIESGQIATDFLTNVGNVPNKIVNFNDILYIVNSTPDEIKILDPLHDNGFTKSIALPAGSNPWDIGFTGSNLAYVTLMNTHQVAKIDLATGALLDTFAVGKAPEGILIAGNEAWVVSTAFIAWGQYEQSTVSLISTIEDSVITSLDIPVNAQALAKGPDPNGWGGTFIHALCTGDYADKSGRIAVIDRWAASAGYAPAVVDTIEIGGSPGDILITPQGKGYCSAWGGNKGGEIYIYNALTFDIIRGADNPVYVGHGAMSLSYDEIAQCIWITNSQDGTVQQFSTETDTVIATYQVSLSPSDIAFAGPLGRPDAWADAVIAFTPGDNAGYGANFFPNNVLGAPDPDPAIGTTSPCANPRELLSLGVGGEIILAFEDNKIVDGDGIDFTIFENAFISWSGSVVSEPAIVSVSQDGQSWTTFSWDTTGGVNSGLAGLNPTDNNQQPINPEVSGGDQFDLSDTGLDWIKYIKITDLGTGLLSGNSAGFDLDAIVAVNSDNASSVDQPQDAQPELFNLTQNYPNPFNPHTSIDISLTRSSRISLKIYNAQGQMVRTLSDCNIAAGKHTYQWDSTDDAGQDVASGLYFCRLQSNKQVKTCKLLLVR